MLTDLIIIAVLAVLVGGAIAYIVRAKRSGVKCIGCPAGGSCPGGSKPPRKKLSGRVIGRKIMGISGMHCAHCTADVAMCLNRIDGVSAEVSLSRGLAKISYDREVSDDILKSAVEKIGYHVTYLS